MAQRWGPPIGCVQPSSQSPRIKQAPAPALARSAIPRHHVKPLLVLLDFSYYHMNLRVENETKSKEMTHSNKQRAVSITANNTSILRISHTWSHATHRSFKVIVREIPNKTFKIPSRRPTSTWGLFLILPFQREVRAAFWVCYWLAYKSLQLQRWRHDGLWFPVPHSQTSFTDPPQVNKTEYRRTCKTTSTGPLFLIHRSLRYVYWSRHKTHISSDDVFTLDVYFASLAQISHVKFQWTWDWRYWSKRMPDGGNDEAVIAPLARLRWACSPDLSLVNRHSGQVITRSVSVDLVSRSLRSR